jgi:hypothetical protein
VPQYESGNAVFCRGQELTSPSTGTANGRCSALQVEAMHSCDDGCRGSHHLLPIAIGSACAAGVFVPHNGALLASRYSSVIPRRDTLGLWGG